MNAKILSATTKPRDARLGRGRLAGQKAVEGRPGSDERGLLYCFFAGRGLDFLTTPQVVAAAPGKSQHWA